MVCFSKLYGVDNTRRLCVKGAILHENAAEYQKKRLDQNYSCHTIYFGFLRCSQYKRLSCALYTNCYDTIKFPAGLGTKREKRSL